MQLEISSALLAKHPYFTKNEMRLIARAFWNHKSIKLKTGHIIDFTIPHLGRIKSHGNKKPKKYLALDRKNKKKKYVADSMKVERLLF